MFFKFKSHNFTHKKLYFFEHIFKSKYILYYKLGGYI